MGFGSYDESEQENQQFETEIDESKASIRPTHDGKVRFEYEDASTEDLLETYEEFRDR